MKPDFCECPISGQCSSIWTMGFFEILARQTERLDARSGIADDRFLRRNLAALDHLAVHRFAEKVV